MYFIDRHGDIGQQISCCVTNITPSTRGNFVARKLGNPYIVATFSIHSGLLTTKVRALIDPNNPSTNIHTRMRMLSWLPNQKKHILKTSHGSLIEKNNNSKESVEYTNESNGTTNSTDYTLEDRFIDLYLNIGPKTGLQALNFHHSYVNSGEWIISYQPASSELYHVDNGFINSLNEWDPGKHGWFRTFTSTNTSDISRGKKLRHTPVEVLQKYLNIKVQNCKHQYFKAHFHGTTADSHFALQPLNSLKLKNGRNTQQQYNYRIRKATNILSLKPLSYPTRSHKISLNLAIVTKGGPFKLYPSLNESLFVKEKIDSSFNATVEMDEEGNTWLLLNVGRSCGRLLSGDVRHQTDRSILTR